MGGLAGCDVDHAGTAQRVEIGQHAVGHEGGVYDLRWPRSDAAAVFRRVDFGSLRQ